LIVGIILGLALGIIFGGLLIILRSARKSLYYWLIVILALAIIIIWGTLFNSGALKYGYTYMASIIVIINVIIGPKIRKESTSISHE
jgi:hypothetical protein